MADLKRYNQIEYPLFKAFNALSALFLYTSACSVKSNCCKFEITLIALNSDQQDYFIHST